MLYIHRKAEDTIRKYLSIFSSVGVTGPRQSGKSTLLQEVFGKRYSYVTFDDPLVVERFTADPKGFMEEHSNKVIFDEVQKVPEVFHYIKMEIDKDRKNYGKFILTGSSQFAFAKNISETLAGRIGTLSLLPFQMQEIPKRDVKKQMLYGSYPEVVNRNYKNATEWHSAYLSHYLERDVKSLSNIGNMRDFQRFVSLLAARTSQELNMSSLAREIGVDHKTIQSWISVLQASFIIFSLPPYHNNLGKRIVKRPKIYFYDTGLVCYLTGIRNYEVLSKGPLAGPMFENFVIAEIYKTILHGGRDIALYYFRDNMGLEADLIIDDRKKRSTTYVEIKNTQSIKAKMADSIKFLVDKDRKTSHDSSLRKDGIILFTGHEKGKMFDTITYLNYIDFLDDLNE